MTDDVDKVAKCRKCRDDLEHYEGIPGSVYMTPYWRHVEAHTHPADPDPATIREAGR